MLSLVPGNNESETVKKLKFPDFYQKANNNLIIQTDVDNNILMVKVRVYDGSDEELGKINSTLIEELCNNTVLFKREVSKFCILLKKAGDATFTLNLSFVKIEFPVKIVGSEDE